MPTYRNPNWTAASDERFAPVPGWGVNPRLALPRTIAVGDAPAAPFGVGTLLVLGALAVGAWWLVGPGSPR